MPNILPPYLQSGSSSSGISPIALAGGISIMVIGGLIAPEKYWIYVPSAVVFYALLNHPVVIQGINKALKGQGF